MLPQKAAWMVCGHQQMHRLAIYFTEDYHLTILCYIRTYIIHILLSLDTSPLKICGTYSVPVCVTLPFACTAGE